MRAMALAEYKGELHEVSIADPQPPPGGAVVRVQAAGVCHSDLHLIDGQPAMLPYLPWVLGHEVAGEVVALGPGAGSGVSVGESVAVYGGWGCGHCRFCLGGAEQLCNLGGWAGIGAPGGYAEYLAVPATRHLLPLHGLDPVKAAPLTDAGLTPYRAVRRALPLLLPDSTALVIGAGGLGQYGIQYLKALSAVRIVVVDTSPEKLVQARELGAQAVVNPADTPPADVVADLTAGRGAAAVFDYVGSTETLALAARSVAKGGLVVVVGLAGGKLEFGFLDLPPEATVTTSYWGSQNELAEVLALARDGWLTEKVEVFPMRAAADVLHELRTGRIAGRAVLLPFGSV